MPLRTDALLLQGIAWELDRALQGAAVRKISQLGEHDFVLTLYGQGDTFKLLISLIDDGARVHLVGQPPAGTTGQTPGAFCMLLRKHLEGARLTAVDTWGLERVLCFHLRRGAEVDLLLAVEMTVVARNMLLSDGHRVLGTWHRTDERAVLPGVVREAGPDTAHRTGADLVTSLEPGPLGHALVRSLFGINKTAAAEIAHRAGAKPEDMVEKVAPQRLADAWDGFRSHLLEHRFVPTWCEAVGQAAPWAFSMWAPESTIQYESFSVMLEQQLGTGWARRGLDLNRQAWLERLLRQRARLERRMQAQQENLDALRDVEGWQRQGELLLTVTGASSKAGLVTVTDYYADPPQSVTLAVDPRLSVSANAQARFTRYKKGLRGRIALSAQLEQGRLERRYLEELELAATQAENATELAEVAAGLDWSRRGKDAAPVEKRQIRATPSIKKPAIRRYRIEGFEVLVGRNPRQNEEIALRLAAPDDLWLHARQVPGAHVLIRQTGPGLPDSVLLTAATLAAINSKARAGGKVAVDYTRARYVRKPPLSPPGTVTYRHEKTVTVRTDAAAQAAIEALVQS